MKKSALPLEGQRLFLRIGSDAGAVGKERLLDGAGLQDA